MKKKIIRVNKIIALIIIITFLSVTQTVSADFKIIQKPEEAAFMYVIDLNNNGEVLGAYWIPPESDTIGEWRVFIWSNGVMETLESGGWNTTVAWDFNDEGDVVGFYGNMTEEGWVEDETLCLSWRDVGLIDLTGIVPEGSMVTAINNQMHMAGGRYIEYTEEPLPWGERAFLLTYDILELGTLWTRDDGYGFSIAYAVNENDQVVGESDMDGSRTNRAYRWTSGEEGMINLGILSSEYEFSYAVGINNNGDVIGTCSNWQCIEFNGGYLCWAVNQRAFLYPDDVGEMIDLGMLPGRTISEPQGINDNKLIVGLCANETGEPYVWEDQIAFIWREGEMFPLSEIIDVPNIMEANEINNQGQIIGMALNSDSEEYFFLWTPQPPVAYAGDDQTVAAGPDCMVNMTLDGSGSSDPDSTPGTNDDIVAFKWYEGDSLLGSGEMMECKFSQGEHIVTLLITDKFWQTDDDEVTIVVQDTTPPEVSLSISIDSLWPPNHEMVDVGLNFEVSDICDPEPVVSIKVTSDEPTTTAPGAGGPEHAPDAEITDDGRVLLRAERSGEADGRVYVITVTATDSSGNIAYSSASVKVNHDKKKRANDSGQNYDATLIN